jgi:hypothetical protein
MFNNSVVQCTARCQRVQNKNGKKIKVLPLIFSGFSHRPEYHLFRLGESASLAVTEFAEKGSTEVFDKQKTQNTANASDVDDDFVVLDGFSSPPIEAGVGTSQASIFLDGNHTRVCNFFPKKSIFSVILNDFTL